MDLIHDTQIRLHSTGAAAGQVDVDPTAGADCKGFGGVTFIVTMGAITSGAVVTVYAMSSADDVTYAEIADSEIDVLDTEDDKVIVLDVRAPSLRYVKCVVSRATQDAAVRGIVAILHSPRVRPTANVVATTGVAKVLALQLAIQGPK